MDHFWRCLGFPLRSNSGVTLPRRSRQEQRVRAAAPHPDRHRLCARADIADVVCPASSLRNIGVVQREVKAADAGAEDAKPGRAGTPCPHAIERTFALPFVGIRDVGLSA